MRIPLLRPIALAVALLVAPSAAEAAFLPAFTGHGEFSVPNSGADGIVNFAVYENTGTLSAADFGGNTAFFNALTGGQTFGTNAAFLSSKYIYFYQVANSDPVPNTTNPTESPIDKLLLGTDIALVTAAGTAIAPGTGFVFSDADGAVNTTNALGTGISSDLVVNGVPGQSGVAAPTFVADSSAVGATFNPASASVEPGSINGFGFQFPVLELALGKYSTILFIASNSTPSYMPGNLSNGANHADGDVPLPTPEPGTMALLALGLPVIGVRCVRRFRRGAAEATA